MKPFVLAFAIAAAGLAGTAIAADGDLDPAFLTEATFPGYGFYPSPYSVNGPDTLGAVVPTADGKYWLVGKMLAPGGARVSLYRVQANGYPDVDFGDLGLRTYVRPCEASFNVADAALDTQGRLVVAIEGCPDFMVYRFLPNGDLDTSLAGTGLLTIGFDQGGNDEDFSQKLALTPADGIVVAGTVATDGVDELGIAHYTAQGLPKPGFGVAGKVRVPFEWRVSDVRGVNGAHVMADGRIVVAGAISETDQAVADKKQFVVRVLSNGQFDPSYGNTSAGISKINLRSPLGLVQSPWTYASWMEPNGAVIQVGMVRSTAIDSDGDVFLMRWRPDGQVDNTVGPHGTRQYALDFAGPAPGDPTHNWESAGDIVRQGDGKWLITGTAYAADGYPGMAVLRLNRNFSVDTSFGVGGKIRHLVEIASNGDHGLLPIQPLIRGGRIVVAAVATTGFNERIQTLVGLQNDHLFGDTFD